jgi:branched-subunit amino acid ABC-type transport system permease component
LPDLYVGKFQISTVQLVVLLIALAAMVTLNLITKRTNSRSMKRSPKASKLHLLGITFDESSLPYLPCLLPARLAAVLYGLRYGVVDPYYGFHIGLIGLIVMVLGVLHILGQW